MSRQLFIRNIGVSEKSGKPYAQGVIDLNDSEQLAFARAGGSATTRVTGIINGIPDDKLSLLSVGDFVEADEIKVSMSKSSYADEDGEKHESVNVSLTISGRAKRIAAPVADCDW